jgi:DNA-binding response OmpR family regulator
MALRILFVEKDSATEALLVPGLERQGLEVWLVRTLRQALARIRSARPDLLIVDVPSFSPNGYHVADAIRSKLAQVPVILLLEKGHESAGSRADEFMVTPFTSRKLLHRVKKLTEALASRELRAGPLFFDPELRHLHKGDAIFYLRPKEAALMLLFMQNQGRVLTRQELMKKVWETEYMGDTRTLSVHIRWLREKIEDEPHRPLFLRTVRGVGYRFAVPDDLLREPKEAQDTLSLALPPHLS